MNGKLFGRLALSVGFHLVSIAAFAHHGGTSLYDLSKVTTVKATITDFVWSNPHCEISFDGVDENGKSRHWTIEAHPPNIMVTHGWTRKSLKPGDVVTMTSPAHTRERLNRRHLLPAEVVRVKKGFSGARLARASARRPRRQ